MRPLSLCFGRAKLSRIRSPYRPCLEALETRNLLSVCTVDRLTDNNPDGGGEGSGTAGDLRWCVIESLFRADTINFSVAGVINLRSSLPDLVRRVSIEGPGADLMTVRRDTGGTYPIFTVAFNVTVGVFGLTLTNGNNSGIRNYGALTIDNSTISGNSGTGGIFNTGALTIHNSTISANSGTGGGSIGSGISNTGGGTAAIYNSTISRNSGSGQFSGGISNSGTLAVYNSTIFGNSGSSGIFNGPGGASSFVINSSITGNSAMSTGGGVFIYSGTLVIGNSTIASNSAIESGGGIYVGGALAAQNTIIAGNRAPAGPDVFGNLGSRGHNLISNPVDLTGWIDTDLLHVNPLLGPLQDNGGPTLTMALSAGSPALNAGDRDYLGSMDQRGVVRKGGVNIGAYQASASAFVLTAPQTVSAGVPFDVAVAAVDVFGQQAVGYTGTVTFSTTDPDPGVVVPADYTFTLDDGGMRTFTDTGLGETTLLTPGDQILTVTDTSDNTITGGATITVISAGPGPWRQPRSQGVLPGLEAASLGWFFAARTRQQGT